MLWSIAAGPLVNVALLPVLFTLSTLSRSLGWAETMPNVAAFLHAVWLIDLGLLIFNILPIYPLDGGKILYALLWFVLGRARSLMVATVLGFIGILGLVAFAIFSGSLWLGAICVFIGLNCYGSFKHARELLRIANAPRHEGYHCPLCKAVPPMGDFWSCGKCRKKFDAIATQLVCPNCNTRYERVACFECHTANPLVDWISAPSQSPPQ